MKIKSVTLFLAGALFVFGLMALGDIVYAARTVKSYDAIVPGTGSYYSGTVKKSNTSKAVNNNKSIGGGKRLLTSATNANNNVITKEYDISSGSRIVMAYKSGKNKKGSQVRLKMKTPLSVWVDVRAKGTWSPDQK